MRIHLILRSIWPQRTHSEDVHVGVVEILCLGDGAYPAILPNKSLLGGVAMEMRVSCRTPVLPRIGFGADLTRRKRRARRSNTLPRQLTASCCSPASVWIHVVDSAEEIHAADVNHPICGHLQLRNEAGLCDARAGARGAIAAASAALMLYT